VKRSESESAHSGTASDFADKTLDGRYVLKHKAGEGGSAVVYRALDVQEERPVAVKFLNFGKHNDATIAAYYDTELTALQRLRHDNIVQLLDFGREDGDPYLVFEWLEDSLADKLRGRPLPSWDEFIETYGVPILTALSVAHAAGIAHRDVSPANVRISSDGKVKLTDFGIAKIESVIRPGMTLRLAGTPPYRPREEEDDLTAPFSRDIFSFGVLTLLSLTGIRPESRNEYASIAVALSALKVDPPAHEFVLRCIHPHPDERPASAGLALAELRNIQRARLGLGQGSLFHFRVALSARAHVRAATGADNDHDALVRLEEEFDGDLAMLPKESDEEGRRVVRVLGTRIELLLTIDRDTEDRFVVLDAFQRSSYLIERIGTAAYRRSMRLRDSAPNDQRVAREQLLTLIADLEQHEAERQRELSASERTQVLEKWERMLRFKEAVERVGRKPITYVDLQNKDGELLFRLSKPPSRALLSQKRVAKTPNGRAVGGEIVEVREDAVLLAVDYGDPRQLPTSGVLRIDTASSFAAIRREERALDMLIRGEAPPRLREVLAHPADARAPRVVPDLTFINPKLDEAKRAAVRAAVGIEDILAIHGPPGTGKTTLIAELILQYRIAHPNARILITAQTHAALDNVLEQLRDVPSLKMLRLASPTETRVSADVRELTLAAQIEKWRREVAENSRAFLTSWAHDQGLRINDVLTVQELEDVAALKEAIGLLRTRIDGAEQAFRAGAPAEETSDEATTQREVDLSTARSQLRKLEEEKRRHLTTLVRMGIATTQRQIDDMTSEAIRALAAQRVDPQHPQFARCQALLKLQSDWQARFSAEEEEFSASIIGRSDVVAATCVGLPRFKGVEGIGFELCIVDEASKATPTEVLIPLVYAPRWVLVGDPKQLPPFIEAGELDESEMRTLGLTREDLRSTVLDHLLSELPLTNRFFLFGQHRMVAPIGSLISRVFYDGRLRNMPVDEWAWLRDLFKKAVIWLSTSDQTDRREVVHGYGRANPCEARVIKRLVGRLDDLAQRTAKDSRRERRPLKVAVLAAYIAQRDRLGNTLGAGRGAEVEWPALHVEVGTVDAFQGREADVLIYSVTRSNPEGKIGFLGEWPRLNVALSRGRQLLVIVGDQAFVRGATSESNPLREVAEYVVSHPEDCTTTPAEL
jgi:hypothetical protein